MRHKLKISVSKEPQNGGVVRCRSVTLREKMLTRLLGRKERVMILIPGNTVESLDITELPHSRQHRGIPGHHRAVGGRCGL